MSDQKIRTPVNDGFTGQNLIRVPEPGKIIRNGYTGPAMTQVQPEPKPIAQPPAEKPKK